MMTDATPKLEPTLLLLLATRNAGDLQTPEREEADLEAEDILTQAEEALTL